jgi:hypothetical protein
MRLYDATRRLKVTGKRGAQKRILTSRARVDKKQLFQKILKSCDLVHKRLENQNAYLYQSLDSMLCNNCSSSIINIARGFRCPCFIDYKQSKALISDNCDGAFC